MLAAPERSFPVSNTTRMSRRWVAASIGVSAILAAAASAQDATPPIARRLPFGAPVVGIPLTPYSLQRAMAEVAWVARVPIRYEALEDEAWQPAPPTNTINVEGQTVEQILNTIVAQQPHYSWSEDDGIIHLRPKTAPSDPNNILNRWVGMFVVNDTTLQLALQEVHFTLRPELRQGGIAGSGFGPTELGLRRFSVSVTNTTVLGVLDAIIKAHGASSWHVTYQQDYQAFTPYRFGFSTFDGWGTTQ